MFNINERIIKLRTQRNWSEYQLAENRALSSQPYPPGPALTPCQPYQTWRKSVPLLVLPFPSSFQMRK